MNSENDLNAALPIREISRLTGVNSVTLRAWERRYGLIKPLRTNKGHRLYSHDDVALIKNIQAWLARGLAIGKVSELLESGQQINEVEIENIWLRYFNELFAIVTDLNLGKLDAFFNKLCSVYPAALISDKLINPVLNGLSQATFGNSIKKSIVENRLNEYFLMLSQRQRQQAMTKRIAIIQLNSTVNPLLNVLLHYGLMMNCIKSELVGLVSASEVVIAVEHLALDGVIIYNDSCSSLGEFQKELIQLSQKIKIPIVVGGNLVPVMTGEFLPHVHIANGVGQQAILAVLEQVFSYEIATGDEVVA